MMNDRTLGCNEKGNMINTVVKGFLMKINAHVEAKMVVNSHRSTHTTVNGEAMNKM